MTRHVLMCEPLHYQVEYEINPWMRVSNPADREQALDQWRRLRTVLEGLGVRVELAEQAAGMPDMTFTANAGVIAGARFVAARFRHEERRAEEPYFGAWAAAAGYEVIELPGDVRWEGEGDLLDAGAFAVGGYGFRTDERALQEVGAVLDVEVVRLALVDPRFYHLDTCFCPLGGGMAMWYPPAFSDVSQATVRGRFRDLIEVSEADARRFACNAVAVGQTVVMNEGCADARHELGERGFTTVETPLGEFLKAGGSAKCLVMTLDSFG